MRGPIAVDARFSVIDESDDWIVVNKAAPLIVHPTGKDEPTLIGGLDALLAFDLANGAKLGLINRLDRETSGVVVVAKRTPAARVLSRSIERRQVTKVYRAIVYGWPEWEELSIDQPIIRQGEITESAAWVKQMVHPDGRACQTRARVRQRFTRSGKKFSELEVHPRTGRMHQIRVHLAWAGFSIVGDKLYGKGEKWYLRFIEEGWIPEMEDELILPRHALHACSMDFYDLGLKWEADLATDLVKFLEC